MSKRRSRKLITSLFALAIFLLALTFVFSRVVASNSARRYLTTRLEQAFGRPVDVSKFSIRWIPTPGIIADRVTIAEDPRFGQEYFLRAESIVASPRWRSLFLAKLELGTLELSHPSLNLVRSDDGRWNVESWLPPPSSLKSAPNAAARAPRAVAQLSRIEIDSGRINFSRGIDRRPFALTELTGSIEQESAGTWRIALAAYPLRADVRLQRSGTLSVAGIIAGTSARLHPANLEISWSDASLADALRLALGNDPGIRGDFGLQVNAHTEPESAPANVDAIRAPVRWNISLSARLSGLHRWDMAARSDNPAANLFAEAEWDAGSAQIALRNLSLEAPHSKITGTGTVGWSPEIDPEVHLASAGISFEDIFAWYRSFQPGVADGLVTDGFLTADAKLGGWPPRVREGKILSDGATIHSGALTLAKSSRIETRFDPDAAEVMPVTWSIANTNKLQELAATASGASVPPADAIVFRARLFTVSAVQKSAQKPGGKSPVKSSENRSAAWNYDMAVHGEFTHFENLLNAARLIGRPLNANWQVEGGLSADLRWQGIVHQKFSRPTGEVFPRAMTLKLPLLNQAVEIGSAKIELRPNSPRITITTATALGAHWQGTIWRNDLDTTAKNAPAPEWQFDLVADHLDAAEVDRWIGPRARPNWLARIFTSTGDSTAQVSGSSPLSQLHARGMLRADTFILAPLEVQSLRAQIEMVGRHVNFSEFDAKLNGGTISGGLLANLETDPIYILHSTVKNVDVADLAKSNADLRDRLIGQLSGDVKLSFHGIGREQLLDTLKGEARLSATRFAIRGLDLSSPSTEDAAPSAPGEQFSLVNAEVSVDARKIHFQKIALVAGNGLFDGKGTSDFSRAIQLDFWRPPQTTAVSRVDLRPANRFVRVSGSLEAPHVSFELFPPGATLPEPAAVRH